MIAIAAAFGYLAGSGYFAWTLTGPMRREPRLPPAWMPEATENVTFESTDGIKLGGWFLPAMNARFAVVLLHGHGGDRHQMEARAKLFANTDTPSWRSMLAGTV